MFFVSVLIGMNELNFLWCVFMVYFEFQIKKNYLDIGQKPY